MDVDKKFGGSGITEELYRWIVNHVPSGKHILELGSGDVSTRFLSKTYLMTSVEDNIGFLNRYPSRYIHAPLVEGWFDVTVLKTNLPDDYDIILVDGPAGSEARAGFLANIGLFKLNVPFIIDDTCRDVERKMADDLANITGGKLEVFSSFCVINNPMK